MTDGRPLSRHFFLRSDGATDDEWDKDGERRNRTYITASRVDFLGKPAAAPDAPAYAGDTDSEN